ncbi:MAG: hypothetical protein CMJ64_19160 [Planctomycetaceae bacterium]|nr:hypothetical protein [Planctomycetaceae bacterium]
MVDRMLHGLGVSARPYRALLQAYLIMDFRNQQYGRVTYSNPKDIFTPLFWVTGQNLLISVFLSALLFARVDAFFFALMALGASALVIVTSIIVEFNEVVLDPSDLEIIGHQPVPVRTYSAARVTNLLVYVFYITLSTSIVPAIVGMGLRDASWWFFPTFLLAAFACNLFASGAIIVLYAWMFGGRPGESLQEILAWTQAALMFLTFYGGQAVLRDTNDRLEMLAYHLPEWVAYTPLAWMADFVISSEGGFAVTKWWIFAASVPAAIGVWGIALWRLSLAYSRLQPGRTAWQRTTVRPLSQPGTLGGAFAKLVTRLHEERTAYWLCSTMLRRDQNLRMRSWPSLGIVVAFVALGLFSDQLDDPTVTTGRAAIMSLACIYLLSIPIPTIIHNLRFSREHAASWILYASPIENRAAFCEGLRKAITYRILLPVLVVLFAVFAFRWQNPLVALLHAFVGWLVIQGTGYGCAAAIMRKLPFTSPLGRGESLGPIAPFAAAVSSVAGLLATIHYYSARIPAAFAAYIASLFVLVLILRWLARRITDRRYAVRGPA